MPEIGPYRFSEEDVERTLALTRTLFDLLPGGFPPDPAGLAAPFRARAEAAAADAEAGRLAPETALVTVWEQWRAAIEALRAVGTFGASETGEVVGLFASGGGVPKQPIEVATVDWGGVVGDRQNDRHNHGRPWQALCLWSEEVISSFAAQGHPLAPGLAGENVCVRGIPWDRVVPGSRLQIGEVRCEVSSYSVPCKKNAAWFEGGHFDLMHHRHGPVSRVYATVLELGTIRPGDPVVLEPGA